MGDVTTKLEDTIRGWLSSGTYGPGDRLPSERVIADQSGAGRTTVRLVLSKLVASGVLEVGHGRGYFVSKNLPDSTPDRRNLEPWKVFGERIVYDNKWVQLALVDVQPPGIERFEHHVVRLQHVAIAAIVDDQDRVLMLWRYRFVPQSWGWELPGGIVDEGEDSRQTAMREVEEETGWRPSSLEHLITYQPMVGMVDSPHEVFIGRDATLIGPPTDTEEAGKVAWIPLDDIPDLLRRDELLGSGTLVALLHALAFGRTKGK